MPSRSGSALTDTFPLGAAINADIAVPIDIENELGGVLVILLDPAFTEARVEDMDEEEDEVEDAVVTNFSDSTVRTTAFCTSGTDFDRLLGTFGAVKPTLVAVPLTPVW